MRLPAFPVAIILLASSGSAFTKSITSNATSTIFGSKDTITLKGNSTTSEVILDYGANVEGFPTFEVITTDGDTSDFQITYSESRPVLMVSPTVGSYKVFLPQQSAEILLE